MKKFGQYFGRAIVVFCCLFTVVIGGFLVSNSNQVFKLAEVVNLINQHYLGNSNSDQMFEGAVAGVVASLGDKYSAYLNKEETTALMESVTGSFGGIGVYVTEVNGQVVVSAPVEGSPSAMAGIVKDDIIMSVDGNNVGGLGIDQVVTMMKGDIGTEVQIAVMRPADNRVHDFKLVRAQIDEKSVDGRILEQDPNIAYVRISKFASNTDDAMVEEINKLMKQGFKGLILDLRNNGGGDVYSTANIARLFVPEGPIVHIVDKDGKTETLSAPGSQIKVPIVLLVNGYSASASEILAGAMKDTQVATLVGTKTYGKGVVQTVHALHDGTMVKLTQSKYLTPNKNDINHVGIEPDVVIDFPAGMTAENFQDVQLDKAIEVLQRKMAP